MGISAEISSAITRASSARTASSADVAMTSTQVGLIVESQLAGKPTLNIMQILTRFEGEAVDAPTMRAAWEAMAARHDALRLTMRPLAPRGPVQSAQDRISVDFALLDWSAEPTASQDSRLAAWIEDDRMQPMHLDRAPNWRVRLIRLGTDRAIMIWTFHHALLDGGSIRLILDELLSFYDARRAGRMPGFLDTPAASFLDHCRALAGLDHGPAQRFFRDHLAGFDSPNRLSSVFAAHQAGNPERPGLLSHRLDRATSEALRQRARELGGTTANAVVAAWGLVLARCSDRGEAVLGVTRSGRFLLAGSPNYAGCQINTIPYRMRLRNKTLADIIKDQRAFTLATRQFENTPLSVVAEVCDVPRPTLPFDSIVMFDRASLPFAMRALGPHLASRHIDEHTRMATTLMLAAYDDPEMLIQLEYDASLISGSGAQRLAGYVVETLRRMADPDLAPDTPLSQVSMLPTSEHDALISLGTPATPVKLGPQDESLINRFEAVARTHPSQIAVEHAGKTERFTYGQLDARANHLARHLQQQGVRPGDIVGLALPRGIDYVAAMLSVLKAEATFMPLDPSYPAAVLQDMIDRSEAALLLTTGPISDLLNPQRIPVFWIEAPALQQEAPSAPPRGPCDPLRPAYLIFTSGSTGQPKGVLISHRAISHHVQAILSAFDLSPSDRVLQFTSLNFDISVEEILPTLISGARLVMRSDEMAQSIPDFLTALQQHAITVANLPTAFWHVLCAHIEDMPHLPDLAAHMRLLIVGGERPSPGAAERWRDFFPKIRWLNGYGPTEATITATLHDAADAPFDGGEIPIGRPTAGARTYVMAADGSLAPNGVCGELWIGGPVVALGYLKRPVLTAGVFLNDPMLGPPARIYRSGDRVSWRSDGLLAYHGRIDRQVKLRGFRIELGAVEVALERDPRVIAAVAGLDNPKSQHARLLAWVVLHEAKRDLDPNDLSRKLSGHLPAHMLPQIIIIDQLPLTPGGKVDLARLPRPASPVDIVPDEGVPGTDEATARVQAIFSELLGMESMHPDRSFFEIGGDSLLSVRLMSLIERDFGRRLSLAALYQYSTPRQIAAQLAGDKEGELPNCLVPIQPLGGLPPLYAVHILGAKGGFYRPLSKRLGLDQPIMGLTINLLDPSSPVDLPDIAALYRKTIEKCTPHGPIMLIAVSQGGYIAYELAQQLLARGRDVAGLYMIDAEGPGGRPQRNIRQPMRHYLSRLIRNFAGIMHGQSERIRTELDFRITRLRLRLQRRMGTQSIDMAHNISAHQAAIDLAIRAYRPLPYPHEITVFRAAGSNRDTPEALASGLGWAEVAPGRVRMIDTGGDHLTILTEPHVAEFAIHLRRRMAYDTRSA